MLAGRDDVSSVDDEGLSGDDRIYFQVTEDTYFDLIVLSSSNNDAKPFLHAEKLATSHLSGRSRLMVLTNDQVNKAENLPLPCSGFSELDKRIRYCKSMMV